MYPWFPRESASNYQLFVSTVSKLAEQDFQSDLDIAMDSQVEDTNFNFQVNWWSWIFFPISYHTCICHSRWKRWKQIQYRLGKWQHRSGQQTGLGNKDRIQLDDTGFRRCQLRLHMGKSSTIITERIRSMGEGNVFTGVCHSVHRGVRLGRGSVWRGGLHGAGGWGKTPPPRDTLY